MATYPPTLPAPSLAGYGIAAGNATIRTDMESGPARVRRRYTAAPDTATLRFTYTDAQMADFRSFWEGDAQQGAAWWWLGIADASSTGITAREVRPTSPFRADLLKSGLWQVELPVEVRLA